MTIRCQLCKQAFTSLLIPKEKALDEISKSFGEHLVQKHPKEGADLNQEILTATFLYGWYILVTRYADVPESEKHIQSVIEKHHSQILKLLGFDLVELQEGGDMVKEIDPTSRTGLTNGQKKIQNPRLQDSTSTKSPSGPQEEGGAD